MSDTIKGGNAVSFSRLYSGARVPEKNNKLDTSKKAVDSVVSGLDSAKQSVDRITEAATTRIEVIRQNESSTRARVEDVDEAIRLSEKLELNIGKKKDEAASAHSITDTAAIKELLK